MVRFFGCFADLARGEVFGEEGFPSITVITWLALLTQEHGAWIAPTHEKEGAVVGLRDKT